ncbi:hypothetical protein OG361_37270 [Streptomyces sp. NBC_00090]|uniref:hypothetical protein n=1 Tax=Streptomyces sp. NBC_00090 TaxID=2903619 RepID=UPI003244A558
MGGRQDKHQNPGKGREEQERMRRPAADPAHPGAGREEARGKSPEELKRRREEMSREHGEDDMHVERS